MLRADPMPRLAAVLLPLALGLATGCGDSSQLQARYASDFVHAAHAVSVLGVFKDGRMNSDVWEQLGPGLSAPLGGRCAPGYDALTIKNQGLSGAIDDYARANGIGDELLEQLAPAAGGDLIMVVTVAGQVSKNGEPPPDTSTVMGGPPMTQGSKFRGMNTGRSPSGSMKRTRTLTDGTAFEVSVSLYSVKDKKSVGVVTMLYAGQSVDDAVARLAARLGAEMPGSTCGGWNWDVPIDDHRIRELVEH